MDRDTPRERLIGLLGIAMSDVSRALHERLDAAGYEDIRPAHGYLFGYVGPSGARLTDVAEKAGITKQAMGELATDMERLGYLERVPDPTDKRAKLLRLTDRGRTAQATGFAILDDIEAQWAERYGADRVRALRALLEEHILTTAATRAEASAGGRRAGPARPR
jgi:DNA-binding MarR family transcriptional regulator